MNKNNAWESYDEVALAQLEELSADYIDFISKNKTERLFAKSVVERAEAAGYRDIEDVYRAGETLKAGDKVYACTHGKAVIFIQLGSEPLQNGMNILGAHIDSPRLDIKQNPLFEANGQARLDTHYYGGIKHYQWVTLPLALYGVVVKKDGTVIDVNIGDEPGDPVFCVTDLLIHLAKDQMVKKGSEVVLGEDLDILVGNRPLIIKDGEAAKEAKSEPVKAFALKLLAEKYGIEEADFDSAELEAVPAGAAREMGFDRSMILGYGHDDSSCAYPSFLAQLAMADKDLKTTAVTVLVDKEEIGSVGVSGMASHFFENTIATLMELAGETGEVKLRHAMANSKMLSSDVSAGFDPAYASVFDTRNAAFLGHGVAFNKFTGSRGKSGSNDACAEYVAEVRRIMDDANVTFQTCELGKVDAGGGGTIAYMSAKYGMNVIDSGVPVLSMHAPWEVVSKADLFEAYKGYIAFLQA